MSLGCSKANRPTGTVTGKVTLAGAPLPKGAVTFVSESTGEAASGEVTDGTYALKSGKSFSIVAGDYRVAVSGTSAVSQMAPDPNDLMKSPEKYAVTDNIPEKYRSPATSGLVAVVKEGNNPDTNFDLK